MHRDLLLQLCWKWSSSLLSGLRDTFFSPLRWAGMSCRYTAQKKHKTSSLETRFDAYTHKPVEGSGWGVYLCTYDSPRAFSSYELITHAFEGILWPFECQYCSSSLRRYCKGQLLGYYLTKASTRENDIAVEHINFKSQLADTSRPPRFRQDSTYTCRTVLFLVALLLR